jgi:hypothetical protein
MPAPDRKKSSTRTVTPAKAAPKKSAPVKAAPKKAAPVKAAPVKAAPKKAPPKKAAPKKVAPVKAAPKKAQPKKAAPKKAPAKKAPPKKAPPKKAAPKKAAPKRPVAATPPGGRHDGPDPEGFFVARVRGEDAVRDAPHQLQEPGGWEEEPPISAAEDEGLGELPWTYGNDLLVALPRDPRTLFVYWDHARATLDAAFANLPGPKVQLWVFARGAGWDRVRVIEVALEARGWYVHDLEPGLAYRAELHVTGSNGQDRLLPGPSVSTALPPHGASPDTDDRYATLPWEVPLPKLMGPGLPGGPFSEEARALLATLSGWTRFGHAGADGTSAPATGGPTSPSRPSSPTRPFGGKGA